MPRVIKGSVEVFDEIFNGNELLHLGGIHIEYYEGEIITLVAYQGNHPVFKQFSPVLGAKPIWTKCSDGGKPETLTIKIIKIEKASPSTLRVRIKIVNSLFGLVDENRAKQNAIERRDYNRNQAKKKVDR